MTNMLKSVPIENTNVVGGKIRILFNLFFFTKSKKLVSSTIESDQSRKGSRICRPQVD